MLNYMKGREDPDVDVDDDDEGFLVVIQSVGDSKKL